MCESTTTERACCSAALTQALSNTKAGCSCPLPIPGVCPPGAVGRAPSPVMLLVHEMVPCSECHQPGVVRRGWDGDRAGAAHVGMAQLVREDLQFIRGEPVVIPEHIVMGWPARTLGRRGGSLRGAACTQTQAAASHPDQTLPDQTNLADSVGSTARQQSPSH